MRLTHNELKAIHKILGYYISQEQSTYKQRKIASKLHFKVGEMLLPQADDRVFLKTDFCDSCTKEQPISCLHKRTDDFGFYCDDCVEDEE